MDLHHPAGSLARDGYEAVVTRQTAGTTCTSLRVLALEPGGAHLLDTGGEEMLAVPLSGGALVRVGTSTLALTGRRDVFEGPTDFAYLPVSTPVAIESPGGARVALVGARTHRALPFRYGPREGVPIEHRGAGAASRVVRNFGTAEGFDAAAVIACEVVTPGGHWSGYPAHKHDETGEHETQLEEVYYFETASGPHGEPGFGYFEVRPSSRVPAQLLRRVSSGDAVVVPGGWHGPAMAPPGLDLYYLNVMAGPAADRVWRVTDHPDQAWVRGTWHAAADDERPEEHR